MRALVFGSLNIDYVYEVKHFVQPGETLSSGIRNVFCGGKGLNQAIALQRAGTEVWMAGAVGQEDSSILFQALHDVGVHTELIQKRDCPSGHTIIQKTITGENSILVYGGANQSITASEVENGLKQFEPGDFVLVQNEINQSAYILEYAHSRGMHTVLNPSPMDAGILEIPRDCIDYLILNEVEGLALCGGTVQPGVEMLQSLAKQFPTTRILLTNGAEGSYFSYKDLQIFQPAFRVNVVDTTAAGDTFTGFFFAGLARNVSVEKAMELAAKAAAIAVSRNGASSSIPSLEEVDVFGCYQ